MYMGEWNEPMLVSLVRLTCTVHDAFFPLFPGCGKGECRFKELILVDIDIGWEIAIV